MGQPPDDMYPPGPPPPPSEGVPSAPAPVERSSADASMLVLGGLLLIASFLSWYRVKFTVALPGVPSGSSGENAWGLGLLAVGPVLLGLAAALYAGLRMSGKQIKMQMSAGVVYLIAGAGAFVLTVLRFLVRPGGSRGLEVLSGGAIKITRGLGLYIAIVITIGMLVVGLRAYQAEQRR